ncbi:gas vesicle protein GvpG [Caproicibacter fermentans]|uniref:Uncharacterized protein n=1 Tax=Caproicibacter fermentans TaxID=2576756 RepID=A0A7G8TE14_9FIRM|nr:hypothetical protein [Caproicibacter fermentans]QNK41855.1 hypothetical protein HCR03_06335 [Caproicibacter fermentans]
MNRKGEKCVVSDHVAEQVLEMARRYFSDPENVKKYEAWHLKTYGCLPNIRNS